MPKALRQWLDHPRAFNQKDNVNSVHFSHSVSVLHSSCSVPFYVNCCFLGIRYTWLWPISCKCSPLLHLLPVIPLLVPPSRFTPIDKGKLQHELCFHPNQRLVDFVISGITSGFCLGGVVEVCSPEYAFSITSTFSDWSVSPQQLEKGRIAGPYSTSQLPSLHVSRFGGDPKEIPTWKLAPYLGFI